MGSGINYPQKFQIIVQKNQLHFEKIIRHLIVGYNDITPFNNEKRTILHALLIEAGPMIDDLLTSQADPHQRFSHIHSLRGRFKRSGFGKPSNGAIFICSLYIQKKLDITGKVVKLPKVLVSRHHSAYGSKETASNYSHLLHWETQGDNVVFSFASPLPSSVDDMYEDLTRKYGFHLNYRLPKGEGERKKDDEEVTPKLAQTKANPENPLAFFRDPNYWSTS